MRDTRRLPSGYRMHTSQFESLTGCADSAFPEYDDPPAEPLPLLSRWLGAAEVRGVREPRALALATATAGGRASTRIVAVTKLDERGVIFATHATSRKARELSETGWASGVFYWREIAQQVVISGRTALLDDRQSEAMWFARPIPLHAMSAASYQSEPLRDAAALRQEVARLTALGTALSRPPRFVGYRLEPSEFEFWLASPDRLHRRLKYDRNGDSWTTTRLQP